MAIRAFITTWSLNGNRVENPIVNYVDTLPAQGITCSMYYPDADQNGLPDKNFLIVLMRSDQLTGAELETIGAAAGALVIDAQTYNKQLSSLNNGQQNKYKNLITNQGAPISIWDNSVTFGDLLVNYIKYLNPSFQGFGDHYTTNIGDWG